jgi:protein-S-isoprenylcysteine O-methyltransferase Ste14
VNAEPDVPGDGGACTSVLSLLLNAVAPLLLFLPVFALMDRRVIRWEERNLAAKFGEPYLAYLSRIPRWF